MKQPIDLRPDHAKIVHEIIARYLPAGVSLRVFGSRAKWTAKPHSDLDLALKGKQPLPRSVLGDLAEAFSESDLPFRVDIVDWHAVTPSFQAVIDGDGVQLTVPLGEVAKLLSGGTPSKSNGSFWNGDVPWLTPKDMGQWDGTTDAHVTRAAIGKGTMLAPENASFVAVRGMSLHNEIRIVQSERPLTFNQDIKAVVAGPSIDSDFLYYALTASKPVLLGLVSAAGHGTGVLDTDRLRSLEIPVLPVEEQQSIAKTISALDDKIELNRRMNETLEGMAQAIFRDWFVDFGPVRRKAAGETDAVAIMGGLTPDPARAAQLAALFPDGFGDDGLPDGWAAAQFGSEFDLTMGQSPPGDTYNDTQDGLPFFQGRTDFGFRYPENRKYCSAPSRIANADDTLISVRAPVGDLNMAWEKCCIGRGVAAARHKSGSVSYTFYWLRALQPELQLYEHTGTVFGAINRKQFEKLPVIRPDLALIAEFERIAGPMDQKIRQATLEQRSLAETRDYLLPRLMSGTVRVARESEAA